MMPHGRQEGAQGQWQQESSFSEILEQVRGNVDMGSGPQMMRKGYLAMRDGRWEEFKERYREVEKSSEWTLERLREACEKVATDEIGRLGIVQEIIGKSTDFLRKVMAPVGGMGGVTLSKICPHIKSFSLEDNIWWETAERRSTVGGVRYVEADTNGEHQTGYWWCSSVPTPSKQKCFERTRRHKYYVKNDQRPQAAGEPADGW